MPVSYFTFSAPAWPSPSANQIYLLKWQPRFVFSSNTKHSSSSHGRGRCLIFTMTMSLSSSALGAGSGVLPWHVIWEWERGKFPSPQTEHGYCKCSSAASGVHTSSCKPLDNEHSKHYLKKIFMCKVFCLHIYWHTYLKLVESRRRPPISWDLNYRDATWVLEIKPGYFGRTSSTLNH